MEVAIIGMTKLAGTLFGWLKTWVEFALYQSLRRVRLGCTGQIMI